MRGLQCSMPSSMKRKLRRHEEPRVRVISFICITSAVLLQATDPYRYTTRLSWMAAQALRMLAPYRCTDR